MRESSTKCKLFSTIGFIGRNNVFSRIPARICSGAGGIFARFGGDRRSGATLATGARKAEHMSVQERISVKGGGELDKVRGTNRIKRGERRTRRTTRGRWSVRGHGRMIDRIDARVKQNQNVRKTDTYLGIRMYGKPHMYDFRTCPEFGHRISGQTYSQCVRKSDKRQMDKDIQNRMVPPRLEAGASTVRHRSPDHQPHARLATCTQPPNRPDPRTKNPHPHTATTTTQAISTLYAQLQSQLAFVRM